MKTRSDAGGVTVRAVDEGDVPLLAALHRQTIPSFNSSLGDAHLGAIYRATLASGTSVAYLARAEGGDGSRLLGFVFGATDYRALAGHLARSLPTRRKLRVAWRALTGPRHWGEILTCAVVRAAVVRAQGPNTGYLVSIAVSPEASGLGVGRRLFDVFVGELARRGTTRFLVDTRATNLTARRVYEHWGLTPLRQTLGSVIYAGQVSVVHRGLAGDRRPAEG